MNRDGAALTITRVPTPANKTFRSEPGKGKSRAARKRRSVAAIKAVHQLPVVEPRTIASTSSSVLRTFPVRRSAINGRIRLLEHRNLALQAQLRLLRDEFAQYRTDHPSPTFQSSVDLGRPGSIHLSIPSKKHQRQVGPIPGPIFKPKLVFPRSQEKYTTLPDSIRRYLLAIRYRPSSSSDSDQ
jgi:hypothetical protein